MMGNEKENWVKGPWRVGPVDDTRVEAPDGSEIAQIDGDYNDPDLWPIMEANAKLISAAPDLYEALKTLMQWVKAWDVSFLFDEEWPADEVKIKAALAKARGEQVPA